MPPLPDLAFPHLEKMGIRNRAMSEPNTAHAFIIFFRSAPPLYELVSVLVSACPKNCAFLRPPALCISSSPPHVTLGHQDNGIMRHWDNGWGWGAHLPKQFCDFFNDAFTKNSIMATCIFINFLINYLQQTGKIKILSTFNNSFLTFILMECVSV